MNTKVSNCITYIPQDIKLELNNGTLTLKAGSKVYVPNGAGVFDTVTIANDINYRYTYAPSSNSSVMLFINQSGTEFVYSRLETACFSGETQPSGSYVNWYKTNENRMYSIGNNATIESSGFSFPIAKITQGSDGVTKSIDQVFNGFGYIGSTIYALPGVKGLIPNGRNEDGSLKNIEAVTNNVITTAFGNGKLYLSGGGGIFNSFAGPTGQFYNERKNIIDFNGTQTYWCECINIINSNFTPKTVFHALDYNDKSTISGWSMPSSRYIDLTLGASGSAYAAPANGYFSWYCYRNNNGYIFVQSSASLLPNRVANASNDIAGFIPVKKGDIVWVEYANLTFNRLRFIYAEGESYDPVSSSNSGGHEVIGPAEGGGDFGPAEGDGSDF